MKDLLCFNCSRTLQAGDFCSNSNKLDVTFLFINSFVLHYIIDEGVSPLGKTTFQSGLQSCKHLGMVCSCNFVLYCVI